MVFINSLIFFLLIHGEVCKKGSQIIIIFTRATIIVKSSVFWSISRMYLLLFAILSHETFVADVGAKKAFVDGDVGGVLIRGGVGGAFIGVPFSPYVRLTTLLLVVIPFLLHLFLPFLVVVPITITCIWTFSNKMAGLTKPVEKPLGAGFVVLPLPLLGDLPEALDDKSHLLIVKLGSIKWEPTCWCRLFLLFFRCLEWVAPREWTWRLAPS
jgi:hypothetical protein